MASSKKSIRDIVSPVDLMMVVGLLRRVFRRNEDISNFLKKIDEPHELDRLYQALAVLIGLVDGKDPDVEEDVDTVEGGGNPVANKLKR